MAVRHCARLVALCHREKLDRGPSMPCTLHTSQATRLKSSSVCAVGRLAATRSSAAIQRRGAGARNENERGATAKESSLTDPRFIEN